MQPRDLVAFDLRAARKERNLSQLQTAEMLCTTQPTISRWEAEGTTPAIVRKAWDLHWKLEDLNNGNTGTVDGSSGADKPSTGKRSARANIDTKRVDTPTPHADKSPRRVAARRGTVRRAMEVCTDRDD